MAKRSNSNDGNGLEEALAKGLGSLSTDSEVLKDNTKEIKKGVNSLKNSASDIKKTLREINKSSTNAEGELKNISRDTKEMRSSLKNIAEALKNSSGAPIQDPAGMQEPGSKVMGMAPSTTKQSTALTTVPGSKIAEADKGSTALIAQGKENTEATKNLGNKITTFFSGKVFFGKLLGTIVDGIIGSKLLHNTLMDVFKLGVYLFASAMRTLFGKHFGGITAILLAMFGSLRGLKSLGKAFKIFQKTGSFKMAGKAGFKEMFKLPFGLNKIKGFKLPKIGSKTVASVAGEEAIKIAEKQAIKKGGVKVAEKGLLKGLGKAASKKVPLLGIGTGLLFGAQRAKEGDMLGAGGELISGLLPTIGDALAPVTAGASAVIGNAASIGIDAWLMKRDFDKATGKSGRKVKTKETGKAVSNGFLGGPWGKLLKNVILIASGMGLLVTIIQKIWNWLSPMGGNGGKGLIGKAVDAGKNVVQKGNEAVNTVLTGGFDTHNITGQYLEDRGTGREPHQGVDLAYKKGEKVQAKLGGKVVAAQVFKGYGNTVIIDDGEAYELYGHLDSMETGLLGKKIPRGTVIGKAGNTGIGTGPHLHYEVRKKQNANASFDTGTFFNKLKSTEPISYTNKRHEDIVKEMSSKGAIPDTPAVMQSPESKKKEEMEIQRTMYTDDLDYAAAKSKVRKKALSKRGATTGGAANIADLDVDSVVGDTSDSKKSSNSIARAMQTGTSVDTVMMLRDLWSTPVC